jgi:hypothetical protein
LHLRFSAYFHWLAIDYDPMGDVVTAQGNVSDHRGLNTGERVEPR